MADIEVVLDKNGRIDVVDDKQPVRYDEFVHWSFTRIDKLIRSVKVEFKTAEYFTVAGKPSKSFTRVLDDSDAIYGLPPKKRKIAAPKGDHVFGFRDKYTITTYDAKNKKINSKDPDIVPIRP